MQRALAGVRHAVFQHQVGEAGEAQQGCLFAPQFQNAHDDRTVVPLALGRADCECLVQLAPSRGVVQVRHHGRVVGRLQGEAPAFQALALRAFACARHRGGRQSGQVALFGQHQFEGVGRIQNVLRELGRDLRQFHVDRFQALLPGRIQVRAVSAEGVHRLVQEAPPLARNHRPASSGMPL